LTFHGSGGSLFGIQLVNGFLTLATLGVYYFWGKVRVRSYLLSETEFEGDRFAYHGTGKELLIGWLKAGLVFGLPLVSLQVLPDLAGSAAVSLAAKILASGIVMGVIPIAMVGARRYRLSRTSWRGIRFSFRGRAGAFVKLFLSGWLLTAITLGLYYPVFVTRQQAFLVSHAYFGNQKFDFDGHGEDLLGSFVATLLLTIPTLGLAWFWFMAKKQRYVWDHTSYDAARFRSTVTGGRLMALWLVNLLLLIGTFGLAWAYVRVRTVRFTFKYLALEGPLDLNRIQQEAQAASPTGEALAGFFDTGFDLG
jgi:uncharacterized membrane protein YjgN (DUF898 family)